MLIWLCISLVSYSILLNGSLFGKIVPHRGICQEDLLSLYLFLIVTKCLSRMISRAESLNLLPRVKVAESASPISHLLYVDDVVIFLRANLTEASTMKHILDKYFLWSSQIINLQKSTIFFSKNVSPQLKEQLR